MPSEIGLPNFDKRRISQPKNLINKPAMNNRRLVIAAVFHFVHPADQPNGLLIAGLCFMSAVLDALVPSGDTLF